jgi:nucleoside-diphosphate-sugar epimerase
MKILLTGPTGFVGSAFARLAIQRGHSVAGLVIPSESIPASLSKHGAEGGQARAVTWLRGTLEDAPWADIEVFGADACVHMAWITTPGVYLESPDNFRFLEASTTFLRRVQELGANYLVGLGTCIEYQITNQPLSEERTLIAPTTTYSRCKNELRLQMEQEAQTRGFKFCWARVFYPYGPGEHLSRLCSATIQKLSRGEKIMLKTPNSTKDYIFIEDLAEALLCVVESKYNGTINLGTGVGVSVLEIAQTLGRMMGRSELIGVVEPPEVDPLGYVVADASRLRRLGWRPAHTLAEGLRKMI